MYLNKAISKKELSVYEDEIPKNYLRQIRTGRFFCGVIRDLVGEVEKTEVLYVTYFFDGWLELVWVKFYRDTFLAVDNANLLRYLIRVESQRREVPLRGVYMDVHLDEVEDPVIYRNMLALAHFECRQVYGNTYEFKLSQVKEKDFLKKAAKLHKCVTLRDADEEYFTKLSDMIMEDDRPTPVGAFPNWNDYQLDDSLICLKDNKPCGALLISRQSECLVLDCAYVTEKTALSAMLGRAYNMFVERYGEDVRILVPVVLNKTGSIVERIVPEARRVELIEAIRWF